MSLVGYNFGEILKSLRAYKRMTLSELAEGICSEDDLLQFEKEEKYPTIDQLYKIALKLDVELNHFFDIASTDTYNYAIAVTELIKKYKRERDYAAINEIILKEQDSPLFKHTSFKQFLMWHEGICTYYLDEDKDKSIGLLYGALSMTNPERKDLTEREIEILTSVAIIKKDAGNLEDAVEVFLMALNNLTKLPQVQDSSIWLKILYGLAQALSKLESYEESLIYCSKGIDNCIYEENMYLFGELHYQTGMNYIKLGKLDEGKEYLEKAVLIFKLQENEKFASLVITEMEKLLKYC
ncbi:helix-turn-helix transcriptional regulator [Mesobacillus subterraneus]|uniref:helix-turn-helix domain-containing protein n=1 Tax=Mesobacillus subterraneus TaxID=285983 RepID=UPI00203A666A|nr:helix-turn-helix transcriptional regulator [Mesobacillus subterraneus]MCM3664084.1 helix-turn-helix transcriptional regulator [Mesobacillus subterraneus]MCM3685576.1 helix-turn-helix transcriptional regulator [Mesobacillus subterraneus]